ncbi:hypothetical protein SAY87_028982 [Trapa incisa]|uniref:Uncharacterized protein n=2 Tax=Trapa TaxID=22665 RepID=A0AAN7R7Z6_TRANT|nr:hypothetical protein SAY87_028982 [Trapa incisa]KAK4790711.1 hypothetical protein SAY86_018015 [Trapa natans]
MALPVNTMDGCSAVGFNRRSCCFQVDSLRIDFLKRKKKKSSRRKGHEEEDEDCQVSSRPCIKWPVCWTCSSAESSTLSAALPRLERQGVGLVS